jgi:hypothetical protein
MEASTTVIIKKKYRTLFKLAGGAFYVGASGRNERKRQS